MEDLFDKLKDGMSKAKDGAEQVAKSIVKHTSNAINGTKLSISINEANNKIKDIYTQIGKAIYEAHISEDGSDLNFDEEFAQIEQLKQDVETLSVKKAELKDSVRCHECGTLNKTEADFCFKCGATLDKAADKDTDFADEYYDANDNADDTIIITPQKS